jgi:radical SAM superfamily enzyme YgiQ (UPF0313 family)
MIKWRARSPENVLSEVDYFLKKTPYTHVFFFDANFFVNPQRAMQIAVGLKKRGLTFAFSSTVKLLLKHMEYIPELSKAGLRMVEVGVENANNDLIKEELGKDHCTDEANEAIRLLKEFNIIPLIDFIMFTPLTKLKHIERNLIFLKNNDYLCKDRYNAFFNFLIIYSGTKIKANIEKNSGKSLSVEKLYSANDLYEDKEIKLLFNFFVGFFEKNFLHKILLQQKKILAICTLFDRQEVKIYDLTKKIQRLKYNSLLLQYLPAKILSKSIELLKTGDVLNVRLLRNCVFKNIEGKMSLKEFLALNDSIINDCESRLAP